MRGPGRGSPFLAIIAIALVGRLRAPLEELGGLFEVCAELSEFLKELISLRKMKKNV